MKSLRSATLVGVLLLGAFLFTLPIATGMFAKTQGVERLTSNLRPTFEASSLTQTRSDLDMFQAMSDQLQESTLPALPVALNMSPEQFQEYLLRSSPDVASGVSQLDMILPKFQGLVGGLESQAANFRQADRVPTDFLPSTVVPYLFLVPGAVLFFSAAAALAIGGRKGGWASIALGLSLVFGAVFIATPLVVSVPAKAHAVDELQVAFGSTFTTEGAADVRSDMDTVQDMADQLQSQTLPNLATALNMSPSQFQDFMQTNFPAVATGISQFDTVLPRFQNLTAGIEANVDNFIDATSVPTADLSARTLTLFYIIPGAIAIALGGAGLLAGHRTSVVTEPAPSQPAPVPAH